MEKYEIFDAVLQRVKDSIERGEEIAVSVKDLSTMSKVYVKAIVAEKSEDLKGGEPLRVVNDMGERVASMYISIRRELSDEEVKALPTR